MTAPLAALLARRLCHDFAGPAGAIGTAVDMLGDAGDPELIALTADSAQALTAALELYRYILTPSSEPVGGGRARQLLAAWLAARGGPGMAWPEDGEPWPPGFAALTAGLAMVAAEAAPRTATLRIEDGVVSVGKTLLPADVAAALGGGPADTTRAALAGVLAAQAAAGGIALAVEPGEPLRLVASYQSNRLPR